MQPYTLVVVDMQTGFEAAHEPTTLACVKREINSAFQNNNPIIFLEVPYFSPLDETGLGHTLRELTQPVINYNKAKVVEKMYSDGSWFVLDACQRNNFDPSHIRICGVNSDVCVFFTAIGLAASKEVGLIEVITDACNTITKGYNFKDFQDKEKIALR